MINIYIWYLHIYIYIYVVPQINKSYSYGRTKACSTSHPTSEQLRKSWILFMCIKEHYIHMIHQMIIMIHDVYIHLKLQLNTIICMLHTYMYKAMYSEINKVSLKACSITKVFPKFIPHLEHYQAGTCVFLFQVEVALIWVRSKVTFPNSCPTCSYKFCAITFSFWTIHELTICLPISSTYYISCYAMPWLSVGPHCPPRLAITSDDVQRLLLKPLHLAMRST